MLLHPIPQSLQPASGFLDIPCGIGLSGESPVSSRIAQACARLDLQSSAAQNLQLEQASETTASQDSYQLVVDHSGIHLSAPSEAGLYYGLVTLSQLAAQNPRALPRLTLRDQAAFEKRGFMLDVSRCRVPTLDTLERLVDTLSQLKYNQLQLYTEHTFAYAKHRQVWKDSSPFDAQDIRRIDRYCRERFIELVPNQNTFGHMERWLAHDDYKRLAECPDGFQHPLAGWKDNGSTLRPCEESAQFVAELLDELLPNFSSQTVNIGGDEPWELGQGRSASLVERHGKRRVYIDHLKRIQKAAAKRGSQIQYWGDIAIEEPALAQELGPQATALLWGYEADHPFDAQCAAMQAAAVPYLTVPGTSSWNSLTGRWSVAKSNLSAAARAASRRGAQGLLLAEWGDNGHHQASFAKWRPIVLAAGLMWRPQQNQAPDIPAIAKAFLPREIACLDFDAIATLSAAHNVFSTYLHNEAWLNKILFAKASHWDNLAPSLKLSELEATQEILAALDPEKEARLYRDLLSFAASKGRCIAKRRRPDPMPRELVERFRANWLADSREGGLTESIRHLVTANQDD